VKANPDRSGVPSAPATLTNNAAASVVFGSGNLIDQAAATPPSLLVAGDVYTYTVTSVNEQGESAASISSVAVTITSTGNKVTFKIGDPAAGNQPTHYAVYRTANTGSGPVAFIGYVARNPSGTTLFTDLGNKTQGGGTAYMFDMRPEVMIWRQLSPLLKINLAAISTAKEFLLWLAGALILFAPRKSGIIDNIGVA
jgi:hypothetical protein